MNHNTESTQDINRLAAVVKDNTGIYERYLRKHNLPLPSHSAEETLQLPSTIIIPHNVIEARDRAINASQELSLLLGGPARSIISGTSEQFLAVCLHFICRHKIALRIPLDYEVSADELAIQCGLDKQDIVRTLRCARAWHVFTEPKEGYFAHTATSRHLREHVRLHAWITNATEEVWPSISHLVDAMGRWPGSEDAAQTAWSLAHGSDESVFTNWNRHPEKAADFITAMSYWNTAPGFEARHLLDQFDFNQLPDQATFVDLGGSLGYVCKEVTQAFPHIKTIAQDLPATIEGVPKDIIPAEIRDRVQFMAHDFFRPQPVVGAAVYHFRAVLHDWSDAVCVQILQNLVPAMVSGARVLVQDTCVPEFGEVSMAEERRIRSLDITMKAFANAKERTAEDWRGLFSAADHRFGDVSVRLPSGGQKLALISALWKS
ncbi:S-adenosyl-L-methionine-dependent methyltransferase [Lophiostoma macrostomum CBS 122681]|uniref:S-adenosyl-L-methionine-dependent methyltransferase n=1 Tax=Lophiostoma macrostomum CBS 122681 TaxID=1314788 RepID=A0A6A6TQ27_9PLEO|nr:S-adenosyl-L-methionine-dependent methyltransferase [Lophiostoma macrostomum CBS 122681]